MKMKSLFALLLLLPTLALAQTIRYENSAFSADFPAGAGFTAVKADTQPSTLKGGETITLYQYSVGGNNDNVSYLVMISDYPSGYGQGDVLGQVMSGSLSVCTNQTNFQRTAAYIGDLPANQFSFKCNDEKNSWFYVIRDAVVYINGTLRLTQLIYVNKEMDFYSAVLFFNTVRVKH